MVKGLTDSRHATVQLADGTTSLTLVKHVLPVGGAGPCPDLQIGDYVFVRVRTRNGPHPAYNGSCDYYIPGIVQVLPADSRKSHALHSVMVFNGRVVTCSRRGMVKISTTVYITACKYIRARIASTGMKTTKQSHSHSENEFHFHSGSEYDSSRSQSRTSVHIPSVSSQYNIDEEARPETTSLQHVPITSTHSNDGAVFGTEIPALVEQQRSQGELLEQYRHDIDTLKHRQSELEENLSKQNSDTVFTDNPQLDLSNTQSTIPQGGGTIPDFCDQGVNTGPLLEDKGVETEPLKESRGVGTDWSDIEDTKGEELPDGVEETHPMSPGHSPQHSSSHSNSLSSSHTGSPVRDHVDTPQATPLHDHLETPQITPSDHHTPLTTPSHQQVPSNAEHATPTHDTLDDSLLSAHHLNSTELSFPDEGDPLVSQEVLARWPDDGWYYRGVVIHPAGQLHYQVKDATHDLETIHMADIITDLQDAQKPFQLGDTVAALHPDYPYSYAPGKVVGVAESGLHFTVELYDGTQSLLPRQEVYHLARAKHHSDVEYIEKREKAWIGQAVIARNDSDGVYYPG